MAIKTISVTQCPINCPDCEGRRGQIIMRLSSVALSATGDRHFVPVTVVSQVADLHTGLTTYVIEYDDALLADPDRVLTENDFTLVCVDVGDEYAIEIACLDCGGQEVECIFYTDDSIEGKGDSEFTVGTEENPAGVALSEDADQRLSFDVDGKLKGTVPELYGGGQLEKELTSASGGPLGRVEAVSAGVVITNPSLTNALGLTIIHKVSVQADFSGSQRLTIENNVDPGDTVFQNVSANFGMIAGTDIDQSVVETFIGEVPANSSVTVYAVGAAEKPDADAETITNVTVDSELIIMGVLK